MGDVFFSIRSRSVDGEERARILESLLNRPGVVERIMDIVEKEVKAQMEYILLGQTGGKGGTDAS